MRYLQKDKDSPNLYNQELKDARAEAKALRDLIMITRSEWRLGNLDFLADLLAGPPPKPLSWEKDATA